MQILPYAGPGCWASQLTTHNIHTTLVLHLLLNLSSCVTFTFLSFVPKLQLHRDREGIEPQENDSKFAYNQTFR